MPNHVKNRIVIDGAIDEIETIFQKFNTHIPAKLYVTEDDKLVICKGPGDYNYGWFDPKTGIFTQREKEPVLGLPDGFEFEIKQAIDHFPDFNKAIPQPDNIFNGNLGQKEEEMCKAEGRPTWNTWNRENWGTKWNSYSCEKEAFNSFTFETAWNAVPKIIEEISKQFPSVQFYYEFSDEDTGYNCGYGTFKGGNGEITRPEGGSIEAYELAFKLRPERALNYKLVEGKTKYQYVDEEE